MSGRIAVTLSSNGIDTISFLSPDKKESLGFYLLIQEELKTFEEKIKAIAQSREVEKIEHKQ